MSDIPKIEQHRFAVVAIASSTGGPRMVEQIIAGLPADLPVPIFIAQHMPELFTRSFATRLDHKSALTVVHADSAMPVLPGTVYVACGGRHMRVVRAEADRPAVEISDQPQSLVYKPSADELLRSVSEVYGRSSLAVVMSGIGRDGTLGAQAIHRRGGVVLTQSAETCAVYGMPKSCVQAELSDAELSPDQIRRVILQLSPQHHAQALTR